MNNKAHITYNYYDENRNILFTKIRSEKDGEKSYHFERIENGIKVSNITGCRSVLYRLPDLLFGLSKEMTIFLVEGEKDADRLLSGLLIATTTKGSLEWEEDFTQIIKNADVVILYDYDKTGIKRKDLLCSALYGQVKRLRVVELPGLEYREKHGQDISDWLDMGNTIENLKTIVENTSDYIPNPDTSTQKQEGLRLVTIEELFSLHIPPRDMLLSPFLPSQGLVLIAAKRGVGKTHIALGAAYAVATGGTFLCWQAPSPKKVLYIDGEMPACLMQERLQRIVHMSGKQPEKEYFQLITPDLQDHAMPDLSYKKGRDTIEPYIQNCDLVILDNISCLFRSGGENEAESWKEAQEWALDLRRRGKSILFVHHAGKSGTQRGTSKKEDTLDTVITLKHPEDYSPEQGARFNIIFDKARHFSGESARSFQVQLIEENGTWEWQISDESHEELIDKIVQMRRNGHTIQAITESTGKTKSQIETLIIKAKTKGLLT